MRYSIVYNTLSGNTSLLARAVRDALPPEDCVYCGSPAPEALEAQRIFVGFWTNMGTCDADSAAFLETIRDREVFLFGTAGYGGDPAYFTSILDASAKHLAPGVKLAGSWMCQGKMPMTVRARYEKMLESPDPDPNLGLLIENFDRALTHPDADDVAALQQAVTALDA